MLLARKKKSNELQSSGMGKQMKGSMRRPVWPATTRDISAPKEADKLTDLEKRLKLALLDQYALANERRGYNPYDTTPSGKPDVWDLRKKRS
jgi:hypothetical protein